MLNENQKNKIRPKFSPTIFLSRKDRKFPSGNDFEVE